MRFLFTLLFAPVLVMAQVAVTPAPQVRPAIPPTPAPQYRVEDLCVLEGRVVSEATGEPVRKAAVRLSPAGGGRGGRSYAAMSDASGRFSVPNVAPGRYRLSAVRAGFVEGQYDEAGGRSRSAITLEAARKLTGMALRLTPLGAVSGRVVDEYGDAVARVQVRSAKYRYVNGIRLLVTAAIASTNDLGEYRIFDVAPGKYYVYASYSNQDSRLRIPPDASQPSEQEDYVPVYYPSVADAAAAVPLEVGAGSQVQNINLRLLRIRTATVRGRVSIPNVNLVLLSRNSASIGEARMGVRVDRQGNFEIQSVAPGSYHLVATVQSGNRTTYSYRYPLEVGSGNLDGVNLAVPPPAEVTGRVRTEDGNAVPMRNARVALALADGGPVTGAAPSASVTEGGVFKMATVGPDRYYVTLSSLPERYYIKSITAGGVEARFAGVNIAGGSAVQLDIIVSPNAPQLTGVVQDGQSQKPAAGVSVLLVPQEKERQSRDAFYRLTSTDEFGQFSFATAPPGDYRAFAFPDAAELAYMDPEVLKPFDGKGEHVELREGGSPNIQLLLITP